MFTHLHVHSEYSLLDGACRISELPRRAKEMGQTSLAITDHGVMFGAIDFYNACKAEGIKAIIGCECYVACRSLSQKSHGVDSERHHLTLLCKNETGYKNLIAMVSKSWTEGFYVKPRIDKALLEAHHEGIIALSGCLAGEISKCLIRGDYNRAKDVALWYKNLFGDDFYLEIQNHNYTEQTSINSYLLDLSKELSIPLVATNDVHYLKKEDADVQNVLLCIGTNHTVGEDTGMNFRTDEFYLKSEEEMLEAFSFCPEAVANTQLVADKCSLEFEYGHTVLPHFEIEGNPDHAVYFRNLCYDGLKSKFGEHPAEEYTDRLEYELGVINKMGYVDYFLIVSDFIRYAKSKNIPVGPGRGSGAGSLAAYCIDITAIDPIKYNLLFERFLNPERVSMPDFDVDFCYVRRHEVIEYVTEKYGADRVAQIVTFGTLSAKAAVRDVGRALGMPYKTVDNIAKKIPFSLHITIDQALKDSTELNRLYTSDADTKRLIDMAKRVEGMPRHASTHAAGIVITRDAVSSYVPLAVNDNNAITQYTMTALERLGLLKFDFLGLRTLTVIDDCVKMIKKQDGAFNLDNIPYDDAVTYAMLSSGKTGGIFQFESTGMRRVLSRLKPESIEDLTAIVSLYRPGPADSIDTYIDNKFHPENISYKSPLLKDILDVTYGCIVYQEQVMEICRKVAGYSYGRADLVRRAMAKKKAAVMEEERHNFIYGLKNEDGSVNCVGALANGMDEATANELFDSMSSFARYAFNKSHACAYAHVSYQTAYLKAHYPCQLFAATLSSISDNVLKVNSYIEEARSMGITILPPSINESEVDFVAGENAIRFGLIAVKNIGVKFINRIIANRLSGGKYTSFYDFCKRCFDRDFNKRAVESLIKAGACDGLDLNRKQMTLMLPEITESLESERNNNVIGQIGLFDSQSMFSQNIVSPPSVDEYSLMERLAGEKEVLGFYVSGHPMSEYSHIYHAIKADRIVDAISGSEGEETFVRFFGILESISARKSRKGNVIYNGVLSDITSSVELLIFSGVYDKYSALLQQGNIIVLEGKLNVGEEQEATLIVDKVSAKPNISRQKPQGVFVKIKDDKDSRQEKLETLCSEFPGNTNLWLFNEQNNKYSVFGKFCKSAATLNFLNYLFGEGNVAQR